MTRKFAYMKKKQYFCSRKSRFRTGAGYTKHDVVL